MLSAVPRQPPSLEGSDATITAWSGTVFGRGLFAWTLGANDDQETFARSEWQFVAMRGDPVGRTFFEI